MKKPFLLIAGEQYYPSHGTGDWIGCFETREEIEVGIKKINSTWPTYKIFGNVYDWYEIVNLETWTNEPGN